MKQALDLNYYPQNYVPKQGEDAPTIVNNFVAPLVKTIKEEHEGEDKKEKTNGGNTKEEEEKTQDTGQEADNDDYLDYSDSDFIY